MAWIFAAAVFISVLNTAQCFNIDPVAWKTWTNAAAGFGYQVVQRQSDVLISAPLEQYSPSRRGKIYKCTETCTSLPFAAPVFAVNMSLGLTMTNDPITQNTMVCGPTIPKDCKSITMYSGACFQIDQFNRFGSAVPPSSPECRTEADIAFLLDGSGSVHNRDFQTMKTFVKTLVRPFVGKDTQFAVVQFSHVVTVESNFRDFFSSGRWESKVDGISQKGGGTYTAGAIRYVVQNVFTSAGGSRPNVKKILIVITDGESSDSQNLPYAIRLAENAKIVRFAIGVGNAFSSPRAKQELDLIASSLSTDHVFRVESFDALAAITKNLQDKIFSIEGSQSSGETLKMEMAQEGFSVAYVPKGIQMGTVGANQWKGGYMEYTLSGQKLSSYEPLFMEQDSYLGYSMTIARTREGQLTIVGAPRYKHRGLVMAVHGQINQKIDPFPWQFQTGEYFGAEVRAMDVNADGYTDLILISAPMYKEADREGRVCCLISTTDNLREVGRRCTLRMVVKAASTYSHGEGGQQSQFDLRTVRRHRSNYTLNTGCHRNRSQQQIYITDNNEEDRLLRLTWALIEAVDVSRDQWTTEEAILHELRELTYAGLSYRRSQVAGSISVPLMQQNHACSVAGGVFSVQ
ncbi:unnamed protein product [Pleuronectes platessa]|uniref:VWFA domain-containing protein n=1 Tax=Pleuronectes platessa TaxID=8262 RepID=A0A9N7UVA7_PLEPL|nr:unnamed protein product [Pleuronectes platessa]